jgi:uncharacterized protein (DUF2147 family)
MNASRLPYLRLMLVTCWFGAIAVHATDPASPIGFWEGEDATFEMFESEGKLSARIVTLSEPKTADGKEKTDIYNPDPKKRNHPIIGLVFISGFTKKSDTRWENGTVYDPKSGKTYSWFMELRGQTESSSASLLVLHSWAEITFGRERTKIRNSVSPPTFLSVVILGSNGNTSRRVWEKLSDQGESHNTR